MKDSISTTQANAIVCAMADKYMSDHSFDIVGEYGEPGYGNSTDTLIVLGYYWCRCDRFGTDQRGNTLHSIEDHYPRTWQALESSGVRFEWYDEWYADYEAGKCYRTEPDSYSWQPSIVYSEDRGDYMTPDDDISVWIDWATDDPTVRAIPRGICTGAELETLGYILYSGQNETGWHPGQNADPADVVAALRREHGDEASIICTLDYVQQFDVSWSVYYSAPVRPVAYSAVINMAGYMPEMTPYLAPDPESAREFLAGEILRSLEWGTDDDIRESGFDPEELGELFDEVRNEWIDEDDGEAMWSIDFRSGTMCYSITKLAPADFEVCTECGAPRDFEDYRCNDCGSVKYDTADNVDLRDFE